MKEMYKGVVNSPETTITNNISNTDTLIYVLDESRVPDDLPNLMTIGTGTNAETIKVVSKAGSAITVVRGFQGVAKAWNAGSIIARNFTEYDYNALMENINTLREDTDINEDGILDLQYEIVLTMSYVGDLESLDTDEKANIVLALNEIYQDLKSHKAENASQHGDLTTLKTSQKSSLVEAINELFTSVSDGKNVIATAISDRGISTGGNATFPQMAANINAITGEDRFERIMDVQRIRTATLNIDLSKVIHAREEIIYVVIDDVIYEMDLNSLQLSGRSCNCGSKVISMSSDELYLYVGLDDGRVLSIKPGPFTTWDQRTLNDAVTSVHAANGLVYVGAGKVFYVLNRRGLTIKQSSSHSGTVGPITASDEFVYMVTNNNYLFKKNALTGETVKYQELTDIAVVTDIMWLDDALYMTATNKAISVFHVSRYTSELVRTHLRDNLGDVALLATEGDYVYTFGIGLSGGPYEFLVHRLNKLDLSTESTTNMTQTPNDFEMVAVSYTKGFLTILGPFKKVHKVMVKGYRPK